MSRIGTIPFLAVRINDGNHLHRVSVTAQHRLAIFVLVSDALERSVRYNSNLLVTFLNRANIHFCF